MPDWLVASLLIIFVFILPAAFLTSWFLDIRGTNGTGEVDE